MSDQKSGNFAWTKDDTKKVLQAFCWSLASACLAGTIAVLALPPGQLPAWLIPLVPVLNAFVYGFNRWVTDNRYK